MLITSEQFKACFPGNKEPSEWAGALNSILPGYAVNTPLRMAAFLAQCGHESEGFTALRENLNYSAQALLATWPKRFAGVAEKYARKPEAIGNRAYAERMGNSDEGSGDGYRYRGRGAIQLTGKDNYRAFANATGRTLSEVVEYLETKPGAVEAAAWFWQRMSLNQLADEGKFKTITLRINGGLNGYDDRLSLYGKIRALLT